MRNNMYPEPISALELFEPAPEIYVLDRRGSASGAGPASAHCRLFQIRPGISSRRS